MNYIVELNFCDMKRKWDTLASFLQRGLKFDALLAQNQYVSNWLVSQFTYIQEAQDNQYKKKPLNHY